MKNLFWIVILAIACAGMGVVLVTTKKRSAEEKQQDVQKILVHSNEWVKATAKLEEQQQVNLLLSNDLAASKVQISQLTNKLVDVSASLAKVESSLAAEQAEVAKRDAKIAELETQNHQLDEKAVNLSAQITNLTEQIAETQRKLAASEGDKAFLEKELRRMMTEKAELERQFNDLTVLRAQVAKLKEELSIARRLDWIRKGLFASSSDQKGAQLLVQTGPGAISSPDPKTNHYDLNVEVNADGSVRVIAPLTNSPPNP